MNGPRPVRAESGGPRVSDLDWRVLYLIGGAAALVAIAGGLLDIVLSMMPGWGPETVPSGATAWFRQFSSTPLLGMRNLDLLNISLSVITLPLYVAIYGILRRTAPALAMLGLVFVATGTGLFISANAALPMLGVSTQYASVSDPASRAALSAAAEALLARGAHGSFGAYPGFLLSELGTLIIAAAMVRSRVFGTRAGWLGVVGAIALAVYTTAYTFASGESLLVMAVAVPGGLLMLAWYAVVGTRLIDLGRREVPSSDTTGGE